MANNVFLMTITLTHGILVQIGTACFIMTTTLTILTFISISHDAIDVRLLVLAEPALVLLLYFTKTEHKVLNTITKNVLLKIGSYLRGSPFFSPLVHVTNRHLAKIAVASIIILTVWKFYFNTNNIYWRSERSQNRPLKYSCYIPLQIIDFKPIDLALLKSEIK